jgi:hypothetical protein
VPTATLPAWTEEELAILSGIRFDIRAGQCSPRREDLPEGAVAGVECLVGSGLVDRVGYYRIYGPTLVETYLARLAEYGVRPDSAHSEAGEVPIDCYRGVPSESGFYQPGGAAGPPNRQGCFINENGYANLRAVWTRDSIYIGVLGNNADLPALMDWAWQDTSPYGTVGGPTVWWVTSEPSLGP